MAKERSFFLNTILAVLWGLQLAGALICKAFWPANILPAVDIPLLMATVIAALLLESWRAPGKQRSWAAMAALAALTFGLLPLFAGLADGAMALKLAVAGAVTFVGSAALFDSMRSRMSSGTGTGAATVISAFVLFLAGQCFTNIFF